MLAMDRTAEAAIAICAICDGVLEDGGAGCICPAGYAAITGAPIVRYAGAGEICPCGRYRARGWRFDGVDARIPQCKACFAKATAAQEARWGARGGLWAEGGGFDCFGNPVGMPYVDAKVDADVDADEEADAYGYRLTPAERLDEDRQRDLDEGYAGQDWDDVWDRIVGRGE